MTVRLIVSLFLLLTTSLSAQFQPIPENLRDKYRFNVARNFFATPQAEIDARQKLQRAAEQLLAIPSITSSGPQLFAALTQLDRLERDFRFHDLYLFARYAINTSDEASDSGMNEIRRIVRPARSAVQNTLRAITDDQWAGLEKEEPKLARFRYYIDELRRAQSHRLGADGDALLSSVEELADGEFFDRLVGSIDFGTVDTKSGARRVFHEQGAIDADPDPGVRRQGSEKLFAGYATKRDALALGLVQMIRLRNKVASARRFETYVEEAYFREALSRADVTQLFEAIARHSDLHRDFKRLPRAVVTKRFDIVEAARVIDASLQPFGPDYIRELRALFDPANGRIDLQGPEPRMRIGGTATVYPAGPSLFYADHYEGFYNDVIMLTHEAGHAVQADLMRTSAVPMMYGAGPGYFTESFGRLNELLTANWLYENAKSDEERRAYLYELVDRLLVVFPSTEEAATELAIHEAVAKGEAKSADDLDAITARIAALYTNAIAEAPERRGHWMLMNGLYVSPMHKTSYPIASLLGLRYFEMYQRDRADFAKRYVELLRNGYGAPPDQLLRTFLGIDIRDPKFVEESLATARTRLAALKVPLTRPSATLSPQGGRGLGWPSPRARGEGARSADEGAKK